MDGYTWAGGQGCLQEKDKKPALMDMLGKAFPKPCLSRDRQKGTASSFTSILQCGYWSFLSTAQAAGAHEGAEAVVLAVVLGGKQSSRCFFLAQGMMSCEEQGKVRASLMEKETREVRFIHGHYVWSLQKTGNAERTCI